MLRLLDYLLKEGQHTVTGVPPFPALDDDARGMPWITATPCSGQTCNICADICPTTAIKVINTADGDGRVGLDLGSCISCGLCINECPTGTITQNKATAVAVRRRDDLILSNAPQASPRRPPPPDADKRFARSLHARVVSTGCSACDAEIGACSNAVFDIERFGVHIVASPRSADVLLITGPVGKGMQTALLRCYEAMAEPRMVVAVGTCAISGGVHAGGYTQADGVEKILPVNVYIPGCPPHPWSIIHGVMLAQGKVAEGQAIAEQAIEPGRVIL